MASVQDNLHWWKGGWCLDVITKLREAIQNSLSARHSQEQMSKMSTRIAAMPPFSFAMHGRSLRRFSGNPLTMKNRTASENLSLIYQLKYGFGEAPECLPADTHKSFVQLVMLMEEVTEAMCLPSSFTESDLDALETLLSKLVRTMYVTLGPGSDFNGNMQKPKVHATTHIRAWITMAGIPGNTDTGAFEADHRLRTKNHASRTNNRGGTERTMLRRDILTQGLNSALTAHTSSSTLDREAHVQQPADERVVAEIMTPTRKRCPVLTDQLSEDLTQVLMQQLRNIVYSEMLDEDDRAHIGGASDVVIDATGLRLHSSFRRTVTERKPHDSEACTHTEVCVHARSYWGHSGTQRYDDVTVSCEEQDGVYDYYARVVALVSYTHSAHTNTRCSWRHG